LSGTSQETVCKVESIDPKEIWDGGVDPLLEEFKSIFKITNETT